MGQGAREFLAGRTSPKAGGDHERQPMADEPLEHTPETGEEPDRRQFIKGASCAIGGAVGLVPALAAVRVALDPIGRERGDGGGFTRLANLKDLEPGKPVMVPVVAEKRDKWSRSEGVVGAVWLLREKLEGGANWASDEDGPAMKAADHVTAFSTICPHLGCFVDFREKENDFYCPCHNSNFKLSGEALNTTPPRPMDELEVDADKLAQSGEVWVKYVRFKTNTSKKIPA